MTKFLTITTLGLFLLSSLSVERVGTHRLDGNHTHTPINNKAPSQEKFHINQVSQGHWRCSNISGGSGR